MEVTKRRDPHGPQEPEVRLFVGSNISSIVSLRTVSRYLYNEYRSKPRLDTGLKPRTRVVSEILYTFYRLLNLV